MGRLNNSLKMLKLIQKNDIIKVEELSKELNVIPRMIRKYRQDLNAVGIPIHYKTGSNGGYFLEDVYLNDKEELALYEAVKALRDMNFEHIEDFEKALKKIEFKFKGIC